MTRRVVFLLGIAIVLAVALLVRSLGSRDAAHPPAPPSPTAERLVAAPRADGDRASIATPPAVASGVGTPVTASASAASPERSVNFNLEVPPQVEVGQRHDLVVRIDEGNGIRGIAFTVSVDRSGLLLHGATAGGWLRTASTAANFSYEVSSGEDSIAVRVDVKDGSLASGSGAIAVVQFEAVAPGPTAFQLSDVRLSDVRGNAIPFVSPSLEARVRAE
jgi:hypothetical protein